MRLYPSKLPSGTVVTPPPLKLKAAGRVTDSRGIIALNHQQLGGRPTSGYLSDEQLSEEQLSAENVAAATATVKHDVAEVAKTLSESHSRAETFGESDCEKLRKSPRKNASLPGTVVGCFALAGCLAVCLVTVPVSGQETATLEAQGATLVAEQAETATKAVGEKNGAGEEAATIPEFVRVLKRGGVPMALQTAVATYRKPDTTDGEEVVLIGAVHIGEAAYYHKLNELFKTYDALLYELVSEPDMGIPDPEERGISPISTIQVGMKNSLELTFQLDEIDYKAKNFVHADMTPQEFFDTMEARKEGVLQMFFRSLGSGIAMQSVGKGGDVGLLAALVSEDRAKGLRRAFAEQLQMMDGQMAALTGEDGKSTLITERNAKAFKVLDRQLKAGKKKLGVFYGAGHLKDMHQRLIDDYGMELVKTEWLDAWEL